MNREDVIQKLKKYYANQERKNGWWFFKKHTLIFERTFLQEKYNREVNLSLPDKIKIGQLILCKKGISFNSKLYKWSDIVETVIKTKITPSNQDTYVNFYYLIFASIDGEIYEIEIENYLSFQGQLGNFIEQYKLGL